MLFWGYLCAKIAIFGDNTNYLSVFNADCHKVAPSFSDLFTNFAITQYNKT